MKNHYRGTNITPLEALKGEILPTRAGTKQAAVIDALAAGASMAQLLKVTKGGKRPWQEVTVRGAFGWCIRNKGYGVKSKFDDGGNETFHLVFPGKKRKVVAHTPRRS